MLHPFSRTELLLGSEAVDRLRRAHVAVFGLGGVGSFAAEALARAAIGALTIIDAETATVSCWRFPQQRGVPKPTSWPNALATSIPTAR